MKRCLCVIAMVLFANSLFAQQEMRHGLSTKFADVNLSGLKPGMVYSIKKEKGLPYKVTNKTDKEIDIEVVVEKPSSSELREGYEPVPDVSWVKLFPKIFHLGPGEGMDCDVIISIPNEEKYANRHFQIMLVTQTVEDPVTRGIAISFAVASRLRFSTGPTPVRALEEHRKKVFEALKMDLTPFSLFLSELPVGKKIKLGGEEFSTLQLVNRGNEDYRIEFQLAKNPERYGLRKDYQPMPEAIEVDFKKKEMKSKKRSINNIIMGMEVPDEQEFYGKDFAFVVVAEILWFDIPIELYSRVYFKTQEKNEEKAEK